MKRRGSQEELAACKWLIQRGLSLVSQNFTARGGELDLVMLDGDTLAIIEVKHRTSDQFGTALEAITLQKQSRIILAARYFLAQHPEYSDQPVRFDAVTMDANKKIDWLQNAFSAD